MSDNADDTADDLEDRKQDMWNIEEVRRGQTDLDTADTSDTTDTADIQDTGGATDTIETSGADGRGDTEVTGGTAGTEDVSPKPDTDDREVTPEPEDTTGTAEAEETTDAADIPDTDESRETAVDGVLADVPADASIRELAEAAEARGVTVDDMTNLNVYLFDRVHAEMNDVLAEVNYRAMKQRGGEVQMNKEFFNAIYRIAARHEDELLDELELDQ